MLLLQNQWVRTDFNIKETAGKAKMDTTVDVSMVQVNNNRLEIHLYWAGKGSYTDNRGPLISAISVVPSGFVTILSHHQLNSKNWTSLIKIN